KRVGVLLAVAGVITGMLGTMSYTVATASRGHSGSIPTSGPASAGGGGGGGFGGGGFGGGGESNSELTSLLKQTTTKWAAATNGSQSAAGLALNSDKWIMAIGGFNG